MNHSSKLSLGGLQQKIKQELGKMSLALPTRLSSLSGRTLQTSTSSPFSSSISKTKKNQSLRLSTPNKKKHSLNSTRIIKFQPSQIAPYLHSPLKSPSKQRKSIDKTTKLRKKMSKEESPKSFMKLRRGETLPVDNVRISCTTSLLKKFSLDQADPEQKMTHSACNCQEIIEKQRKLINQLQKVIESLEVD